MTQQQRRAVVPVVVLVPRTHPLTYDLWRDGDRPPSLTRDHNSARDRLSPSPSPSLTSWRHNNVTHDTVPLTMLPVT